MALVALLAACGGDGGTESLPDVSADVQLVLASFGRSCAAHADCESGLCLRSDYAPFGWCSRVCDPGEAGLACDLDGGEGAVCVVYPDVAADPLGEGFWSESDVLSFCAPVCRDTEDCAALDERFACKAPTWRGEVLLPELPVLLCRGEEEGTGPDVGSDECDTEPLPGEEPESEALCRAYCGYLDACKEMPADLSDNCCVWSCYGRLYDGSRTDPAYWDLLACYLDYFNAYDGTSQVCTAHRESDLCGAAPTVP